MACEKSDSFWLGFFFFLTVLLCIVPLFRPWYEKDKQLTPFEHYLKAKYNYDARN